MLLNQISLLKKNCFYEQLLVLVTSVAPSETLVIAVTSMVMLVSIARVLVDIMVGMVMEHRIGKE